MQKHLPPTEEELSFDWRKYRPLSVTEAQQRERLVHDLRANCESAKHWHALLSYDTLLLKDRKDIPTFGHLTSLHSRATTLIPRTRPADPFCCRIWLDYAILQAQAGSIEDARATFQFITHEQMTNDSCKFYLFYASLEAKAGDYEKAKAQLRIGIDKKVPHYEELEKKLLNYTAREAQSRAHAAPADLAASTPAAPLAVSTPATPAFAVSSVSSISLPHTKPASSLLPPPTPTAADPVTPSAGATRRIKLTGVRTELTRNFGKAVRIMVL